MADRKDDLAARRWFRQRLAELGTQYPHLKQTESQERLTGELDREAEEETPCPENPLAGSEGDPKEPVD